VAAASAAANTKTLTDAPRAGKLRRAYNATSATVKGVPISVDASTTAIRTTCWACIACALVTDRRRCGADVSAGAAVLRIRNHGGTCPVATGRPRGATGVVSAASTESIDVAVARPAGRQALAPPLFAGTPSAEGNAPIGSRSPDAPQPQRYQCHAGNSGPDAPQRLAPRHRHGQ
jgi:hypothetical protein